jgi:hypothetical protein
LIPKKTWRLSERRRRVSSIPSGGISRAEGSASRPFARHLVTTAERLMPSAEARESIADFTNDGSRTERIDEAFKGLFEGERGGASRTVWGVSGGASASWRVYMAHLL